MVGPSRGSRPKGVALYARVSTDKQSTENQLRELREVAERMRWEIAAEFVDRGISGAKGRKDRPRLDAMLKGVARKESQLVGRVVCGPARPVPHRPGRPIA